MGIYYVNTVFALIHDYFAAFTTVIWLIFFWWFSYAYVLEIKIDKDQQLISPVVCCLKRQTEKVIEKSDLDVLLGRILFGENDQF